MQVDAERDARSFFGEVGWVVGFAGLSHPNYKPTMGGKRIGCPHITSGCQDSLRTAYLSENTKIVHRDQL